MEHAFAGPRKILDRLGSMDPQVIAETDPDRFVELSTTPPAIHRYGRSMAGRVQALAQAVVDEYDGDASRIWTDPGADGGPTRLGATGATHDGADRGRGPGWSSAAPAGLVGAGILTRTQRGKWAYYATIPGSLDRVARSLTTVEPLGR
ncbi:hypothetical protein GCM10027059_45160 [Myceligenerans halotolerans]